MKKKILTIILAAAFCMMLCVAPTIGFAAEYIYLGGIPAGFSLNTRGATVVGLSEIINGSQSYSPSKDAGVNVGDIIYEIDGIEVNTSEDIEKAIAGKESVLLSIERGEELLNIRVHPEKDALGKLKLGLFIRNNVSGIGTITYVKNGKFASLGHPVINDSGKIVEILGGKLYNCTITGVIKGEKGKAGELRGVFLKDEPFAEAVVNTKTGVYGNISESTAKKLKLKKTEISEAKIGNAKIYTTVEGDTPKEYDIQIVKVDKSESANKNLVLKISDEKLISITGGIVQGMSGSPILQNGKLVGAVTHVFVNDPQRGFGILIENMTE